MYEFDPDWIAKLDDLRADGVAPYPSAEGMRPSHTSTQLHAELADVADPMADDSWKDVEVSIGGRLMFRNKMGKAMFLRIADRGDRSVPVLDESGQPVLDDDGQPKMRGGIIQIYVRRDNVGEEAFAQLKRLDIGDFVWARGTLFRTRAGELSVMVSEARLASKILNTFPDRFHSVTDVELRSRQRYVDLFMNADTRDVFRTRSRVIRQIRRFFEEREFIEVETPMMQVIPGGAAAKPFVTHHNALDIDLYLRIAPELYLKRLLVGGMERVFEINRSFRNEGISVKHNPEFTMLEFYWAWATVEDLIELTQELLVGLVQDIHPSLKFSFNGMDIDFSAPFRRADMDELISEKTGLSRDALMDVSAMEAYWREHHRVGEDDSLPTTAGKWWEWLFEEHVEHTLVNPTFVTGFPAEISPLARRRDDDPFRTDRFELIVGTWELANAFTELNDPVDQAERFDAQAKARTSGDDEAMFFDADYVRALSYGMPPAAGQGIGIDRLVMLLTGRTSIREVILFPTLRPEKSQATE